MSPAAAAHRVGEQAKAAGNVILRAAVFRWQEPRVDFADLDELAEIHAGGVGREACVLLHVVRDDRNRELASQFRDLLLDPQGRDWVQGRGRLVE